MVFTSPVSEHKTTDPRKTWFVFPGVYWRGKVKPRAFITNCHVTLVRKYWSIRWLTRKPYVPQNSPWTRTILGPCWDQAHSKEPFHRPQIWELDYFLSLDRSPSLSCFDMRHVRWNESYSQMMQQLTSIIAGSVRTCFRRKPLKRRFHAIDQLRRLECSKSKLIRIFSCHSLCFSEEVFRYCFISFLYIMLTRIF